MFNNIKSIPFNKFIPKQLSFAKCLSPKFQGNSPPVLGVGYFLGLGTWGLMIGTFSFFGNLIADDICLG
jgi:hypothetical protein